MIKDVLKANPKDATRKVLPPTQGTIPTSRMYYNAETKAVGLDGCRMTEIARVGEELPSRMECRGACRDPRRSGRLRAGLSTDIMNGL